VGGTINVGQHPVKLPGFGFLLGEFLPLVGLRLGLLAFGFLGGSLEAPAGGVGKAGVPVRTAGEFAEAGHGSSLNASLNIVKVFEVFEVVEAFIYKGFSILSLWLTETGVRFPVGSPALESILYKARHGKPWTYPTCSGRQYTDTSVGGVGADCWPKRDRARAIDSVVENLVEKIKRYRRIGSGYDELDETFFAFLMLVITTLYQRDQF
jgi:hypothetical protein